MAEITRSMKLVLQSLPWKDLDNLQQVRKIPQLSSYPLDEFVSQEPVLEELSRYLEDPKSVKEHTMQFVIQAAPGSGKSRLLQVVGEGDPQRIPSKMQPILQTCLPLAITFDGFSADGDTNPFYETAIRLLFS